MRKLLAVAACAVGVSMFGACGGDDNSGGSSASDPVEGCKEVTAITCDKIFKCFTKEELDLAKGTVGLNTQDCIIKFNADCIPEKANCSAGETFHADKMQQCIDGYKSYTCDDIKSQNTPDPAACAQRCTK
jgi:hypothetical protein